MYSGKVSLHNQESCKEPPWPPKKLYVGTKLREMRTRLTLTQKEFATKLGVSLPYLNQIENKGLFTIIGQQ